ncbi:RHOMBOID-like protein 12 [Forsythia ovata]|uniref:RHOMBOID-like protein 12 n=1 Tax=Forsythia ovata TaxID=205694 RepID=A0ABD1R1I0_9LAMI
MQRQFCNKLLSKISKNVSNPNTNLISSQPFLSSFLKTNTNPYSHHLCNQSFSRYTTLSGSHSLKSYTSGGVLQKIRYGFFFSNPILAKRFFSNTLLKGQSKCPVNVKRNFHSFDSRRHGWRSVFQRLTTDGVVIGLIITNVAVFLLWRVADPRFMMKNFTISVDNFTSGRLHTLITCAFSHTDLGHLMANMVGLYFFGTSMGRAFGPEYLLKLYLSGAVVGSIFYLVYHAFIAPSFERNQMPGMGSIDPSKIPGLGASGAVNAIMLLDIFLFPTKTLYFDFIIPVPAILLGIFLIGKDILRILEGDHRVSGSAHLGGATVAAIAWARSKRGRFPRF